jgi:hypothetical protein
LIRQSNSGNFPTARQEKAKAILRDKYNHDWEMGDWINKGFICDFEKERLVKTSRKRKNK